MSILEVTLRLPGLRHPDMSVTGDGDWPGDGAQDCQNACKMERSNLAKGASKWPETDICGLSFRVVMLRR